MTLAYMAELSAVFNLAYMELRSTRYLKQSVRLVDDIRQRLDGGANHDVANIMANGGNGDVKRVTGFLSQLHTLFSKNTSQRCAAWHTVNEEGETWKEFGASARLFYPLFAPSNNQLEGEDFLKAYSQSDKEDVNHHASLGKSLSLGCLGGTVLILLICTVLSQLHVEDGYLFLTGTSVQLSAGSLWWIFFFLLFGFLAWPALLVLAGRKMAKDAESIATSIKSEFERLKSIELSEKTKT